MAVACLLGFAQVVLLLQWLLPTGSVPSLLQDVCACDRGCIGQAGPCMMLLIACMHSYMDGAAPTLTAPTPCAVDTCAWLCLRLFLSCGELLPLLQHLCMHGLPVDVGVCSCHETGLCVS